MYAIVWSETRRAGVVAARMEGKRLAMMVLTVLPSEAGFLPALDEDQAYMFTPSELRLYQHAKDHSLPTLDILSYPSLFGDILISKIIPFQVDSGGSKRSHETHRRREATGRGDEMKYMA